jgi:hypothetical protein
VSFIEQLLALATAPPPPASGGIDASDVYWAYHRQRLQVRAVVGAGRRLSARIKLTSRAQLAGLGGSADDPPLVLRELLVQLPAVDWRAVAVAFARTVEMARITTAEMGQVRERGTPFGRQLPKGAL